MSTLLLVMANSARISEALSWVITKDLSRLMLLIKQMTVGHMITSVSHVCAYVVQILQFFYVVFGWDFLTMVLCLF